MSFFKNFSKLDDIAFHLVNYSNKKKLKLNLLITKNWTNIIGNKLAKKSRLKDVKYSKLTDSIFIAISCDPSIILELRSSVEKITLKIEYTTGIKVKKINFFQDIFKDSFSELTQDKKLKYPQLKNVNKNKLNDIKDQEITSIFDRINLAIKNEKN